VSGNANYLMVHLDPAGPLASTVLEDCRAASVYLRDVSSMGAHLGAYVFRTAVKNTSRNSAIAGAIARAVGEHGCASSFARGCQLGNAAFAVTRAS
jgi:hypothetical protein